MLENNEVWKDCKGYEGLYQISNEGRIWSVRKQRILSPHKKNSGYLEILLTSVNGKKNMNECIVQLLQLLSSSLMGVPW